MSTSECKKSSSSKSSKKDSDEKTNVKDVPVEEVHTANNWEAVDLGDDQRKQKFLRLMGAKKRKDETPVDRQNSQGSNHDEDVNPEKKHCRSQTETESINRELEKQFNESLQSKIAHIHHGGLGFHGDNTSASSSGDWQHQVPKTKFVPAKIEVNESEQTSDKQDDDEEKKKKKSKS